MFLLPISVQNHELVYVVNNPTDIDPLAPGWYIEGKIEKIQAQDNLHVYKHAKHSSTKRSNENKIK